jgi:hypothetical protein
MHLAYAKTWSGGVHLLMGKRPENVPHMLLVNRSPEIAAFNDKLEIKQLPGFAWLSGRCQFNCPSKMLISANGERDLSHCCDERHWLDWVVTYPRLNCQAVPLFLDKSQSMLLNTKSCGGLHA